MNHMIPKYKFRLKASSTFNYILFLNKIPNCVTRSVIDVHFKQQAFLKKKKTQESFESNLQTFRNRAFLPIKR